MARVVPCFYIPILTDQASDDNRNVRLLAPLQSIALQLGSALWSGDRRNMEIAEGIRNSLVTVCASSYIVDATTNLGVDR